VKKDAADYQLGERGANDYQLGVKDAPVMVNW
jgi:hypothetical protein